MDQYINLSLVSSPLSCSAFQINKSWKDEVKNLWLSSIVMSLNRHEHKIFGINWTAGSMVADTASPGSSVLDLASSWEWGGSISLDYLSGIHFIPGSCQVLWHSREQDALLAVGDIVSSKSHGEISLPSQGLSWWPWRCRRARVCDAAGTFWCIANFQLH